MRFVHPEAGQVASRPAGWRGAVGGAHAALRSGRRAPMRRPVQPETVNAGRAPRGGCGETSQADAPAARSRPLRRPGGIGGHPYHGTGAAGAGEGRPGAPASTSASRTCEAGQADRSGARWVGRRSPGSRRLQPPARRQMEAERARRPHGLVERLLARGPRGVQHDQRRRVGVGHEPALHQLARARDSRPVDARGGRALAVGAQGVELELGGEVVQPVAGAVVLAAGKELRPAPPPPAARTGSIRGSTISSSPPSPCTSRT